MPRKSGVSGAGGGECQCQSLTLKPGVLDCVIIFLWAQLWWLMGWTLSWGNLFTIILGGEHIHTQIHSILSPITSLWPAKSEIMHSKPGGGCWRDLNIFCQACMYMLGSSKELLCNWCIFAMCTVLDLLIFLTTIHSQPSVFHKHKLADEWRF